MPGRRIKSRDDSVHNFTNWRLPFDSEFELEASWSNGFVGVRLVVRRRSTDMHFYGRAELFSDGGGGGTNRGKVVFAQVPCWAG